MDADGGLTEPALFQFISPLSADPEGDLITLTVDGITNSDSISILINQNNSFTINVDRSKVKKDQVYPATVKLTDGKATTTYKTELRISVSNAITNNSKAGSNIDKSNQN